METARLSWLLLTLISVALSGNQVIPGPVTGFSSEPTFSASPAVISAPRQSIPAPVHNEAICAFCQAAVFAPYAAPSTALPEVPDAEHRELLSHDDRLTCAASVDSPHSRAPPVLRDV